MSTSSQPLPAKVSLNALDTLRINNPMEIAGRIGLRPDHANEVALAWRFIVQLRHEPVYLILSRQKMPAPDRPSMPREFFERTRVSAERASIVGWDRYARRYTGIDTFGASAPLKESQKKFGFAPDAVAAAKEELAKGQ